MTLAAVAYLVAAVVGLVAAYLADSRLGFAAVALTALGLFLAAT